jgi:hypothetical protein
MLDIVSRTVVRDKHNGGKWVQPDAGAVRPSGSRSQGYDELSERTSDVVGPRIIMFMG